MTNGSSHGGKLSHQAVPIIPLPRLIAEILNEPLHVRHTHAESGAGLADHILLDHNAAQVIRAKLQRDLADFLALRDPRTLDVRNIVQVNAR